MRSNLFRFHSNIEGRPGKPLKAFLQIAVMYRNVAEDDAQKHRPGRVEGNCSDRELYGKANLRFREIRNRHVLEKYAVILNRDISAKGKDPLGICLIAQEDMTSMVPKQKY